MADDIDLPQELFESHKAEYESLTETWSELEKKSQACLTAAGVLLSLLGATINSLYAKHQIALTCGQQITITLLLLSLLGCAWLSYASLRTKGYQKPPFGRPVRKEFEDIFDITNPNTLAKARRNLYNSLNDHWEKTLSEMTTIVDKKSLLLDRSFCCLLFALLLTALQIWNRI